MVDEESMSGLQLALEDGPQDSPVHLVPNHQVNNLTRGVQSSESPPTYAEAVPGADPEEWNHLQPNPAPGDIRTTDDPERETWGSNLDFLLSIIGFAVDLANVWRFPYLCYKNGGGAFLIPYLLMLTLGALPLFYMELVLGQFHRQGPISVWRICPIFKGLGYCAVLVSFFVSFYYNVIIGWAFHFLISSFNYKLPWKDCLNSWNDDECAIKCETILDPETNQTYSQLFKSDSNLTSIFGNITCNQTRSPAKEYFNKAVLRVHESEGIYDLGVPQWQLILCIGAVYCLLYLSLFKGVKSSGKVVWLTATMPYVVLSILLVRGLMLDGAMDGISFYLSVDWKKLREPQVWIDAAVQIFYSVGAGFGVHLAYASYNKFHNNCYRDCLVTSAVNSFTSFFSGFVIFTYLGYMAKSQGKDIENVADQGPGLVFEVYPQAVATLPGSQFWAVLFFFMLIMLGMDSAMGGLECVITGVMDEFKEFFHKHKISREIFTGFVVFFSFLVAIVCVTPGGYYVFNLLEVYAAGLSLLTTVFFEAVAVSWVYGLRYFGNDIYAMLGHRPGIYWRICWKFISPCVLAGIIAIHMVDYGPFEMEMYDGTVYKYPAGAQWAGRILASTTMACIPLTAIYVVIQAKRNGPASKKRTWIQSFGIAITPCYETIQDDQNTRFTMAHWKQL
ncbi:sodium-dependent dopamine transporter isoform X2 [Eurytemora carolleeae]|uniref:sodium-dependent dopamine transporter isoform X2 n=1 Tax=Eurytemora carolleeae TaxID=1294199 RepID=UPI000C79374A|nr:sodium-dependent dopamine transporter isoform X2 [Eurytemora carolleeae]|eukprot:XP_023333623.1 sodium-dependent dopamine transporter-like isoform X2 [Eurytemora affinis]